MVDKVGMDAELVANEADSDKQEFPKKVALVGSASSSLQHVPWKDESIEIWGLGWRKMKRCELYFEMHTMDMSKRGALPPNYRQHLRELGKPVMMLDKHEDIPNSARYPIEQVIERLGPQLDPYANGDYFVSSIGYMLAFAILIGVEEIHLYGIDLLCDEEYGYQRPNAEYMIGVARGLGIKVFIPKESALCKFDHRYGYEDPIGFGLINPKLIEERLKAYKDKHEKSLAMAYLADGATQELEQLQSMMKNSGRGGYIPGTGGKDPERGN
jgi:hypothetical protein